MFLPENPGAPGGLPWSLAAPPVIDNRTQTKLPKTLAPRWEKFGFFSSNAGFPGFCGCFGNKTKPRKTRGKSLQEYLNPTPVLPDSPFKNGNPNREIAKGQEKEAKRGNKKN